ncbi:hypothetical protein [Streptomyces sp. CA-256286]|uniref:hypothetical protein n=1 Tax=Streptomyces sp. CA-256286 TaxID=2801033 RepID=UPI001A9899C4|nr:hypothetical protein [Streptomyces sp. CA-256286]
MIGEVGVGQGQVEVVDVADGGRGVVDDGADGGRYGGGARSEGAEDAQRGGQQARVGGGDLVEGGGDRGGDVVGPGVVLFAVGVGVVGGGGVLKEFGLLVPPAGGCVFAEGAVVEVEAVGGGGVAGSGGVLPPEAGVLLGFSELEDAAQDPGSGGFGELGVRKVRRVGSAVVWVTTAAQRFLRFWAASTEVGSSAAVTAGTGAGAGSGVCRRARTRASAASMSAWV